MLRIEASRMSMNWKRLTITRIAMPRGEPLPPAAARRTGLPDGWV
jgi:hypothetical protein